MMQLHARSPWDVRRLYRRRHPLIPKALGIYGSVGVRLTRLADDTEARELALGALETLVADDLGAPAWGYHWDMQTRWSFYPAGMPNVVVTAFGASALCEAATAFDRPDFAERAKKAATWVRDELFYEPGGHFVYHPGATVNIHNASLLGAWLVLRLLPGDEIAAGRARRAVERVLAAQADDGSWGYGVGPALSWADSFHTGYVLTCLARLADLDVRVPEALARGTRFYERFFDEQGRAKLWADRDYPEDAHSAGTGLTTLSALVRSRHADRELLERVACRSLESGIRNGHAVYRRYRGLRTTVRYLRWADAHLALGLADAALCLAGRDPTQVSTLPPAASGAGPAPRAAPLPAS